MSQPVFAPWELVEIEAQQFLEQLEYAARTYAVDYSDILASLKEVNLASEWKLYIEDLDIEGYYDD